MRRVPGVSLPRRLSCRRSQFPNSPWRWPERPPRRSFPSHTHCFAASPTHPSHGYVRRPVVPQATGLRFFGQQKRRRETVAFSVVRRSGQLALARYLSWQAPQALPASLKAVVTAARSPEPAATASLSAAASMFLLAARKPGMSLHTVGNALVSLSEPAGNIFSNASSSCLSLAALATTVFT